MITEKYIFSIFNWFFLFRIFLFLNKHIVIRIGISCWTQRHELWNWGTWLNKKNRFVDGAWIMIDYPLSMINAEILAPFHLLVKIWRWDIFSMITPSIGLSGILQLSGILNIKTQIRKLSTHFIALEATPSDISLWWWTISRAKVGKKYFKKSFKKPSKFWNF